MRADEIALIHVTAVLDKRSLNRQIAELNRTAIKVPVDHTTLRGLNKHLDLKLAHLRQVNKVVVAPKTDTRAIVNLKRELTDVSQALKKIQNNQINVSVNNPDILNSSNQKISVEINTAELTKQISGIEKAIEKATKPKILSNILASPFKLVSKSIGMTMEGLMQGVMNPIGAEFGQGIKNGIQKESGEIIGSFGYISERIASSLSRLIVESLEDDLEKAKELTRAVLNVDEKDILLEHASVRGKVSAQQQTSRKVGARQMLREYEDVSANQAIYQTRKQEIDVKKETLSQNYGKIQEAIQKTLKERGGEDLEKQIKVKVDEAKRILDKLKALPTSTANLKPKQKLNVEKQFERLTTMSAEISTEIGALTDKLGGIVTRTNAKYEEFINVLDKEQKDILSEEVRLIKDISPLQNIEKVRETISKTLKEPIKPKASQTPKLYQDIFKEVVLASGVDPRKASIPALVVDPKLSPQAFAEYSPNSNRVYVPQQTFEQIGSKNISDIDPKILETIVHEFRHSVQAAFGRVNFLEEDAAIPLLDLSKNNAKKLASRIERSTSVYAGTPAEGRSRAIETDAYSFAQDYVPRIQRNLVANKFQETYGVGAGKVVNNLGLQQLSAAKSFANVKKLADQYSTDITQELNQARSAIFAITKPFEPLMEKAADILLLPKEEIESLSEEIISFYQNAVANIDAEVDALKQNAIQKIKQSQQPATSSVQSSQVTQEQFGAKLQEEYSVQGLRQVVKQLGYSNYGGYKKDDLIELINVSDTTEVDKILQQSGDSIKKSRYQTNKTSSPSAISSQVNTSLKEANKRLQAKLKVLRTSTAQDRQAVIESIVIETNQQIAEIDKLVKQGQVTGKDAQRVSGYRSYFEQIRQPLAAEFISQHATEANSAAGTVQNITSLNSNQGRVQSAGDIQDLLKQMLGLTTPEENLQVIQSALNESEVKKAKFEAAYAKYQQIVDAVDDRYEKGFSFTSNNIKKLSKKQIQNIVGSKDIQQDPVAKSYAIMANADRSSAKYGRAESMIEDRYAKAFPTIPGSDIPVEPIAPKGISGFITNFLKNKQELIGSFNEIIGLGSKLFSGFLAFQGLSFVTSIFNQIKNATLGVAVEFESLERKIKFASGSTAEGATNLQFLRSESKRLNVDLRQTMEGSGNLIASSRETSIEGEPTRQIIGAASQASSVFSLNAEQQQRLFKALSDMMGKGTVQAEEIRGQLGDVLPGAFNTASRSLGVTTKQLNKMLQLGQVVSEDFLPKFAQQLSAETATGVSGAANSSQAAINSFNNSILELQVSVGKVLLPLQNFSLKGVSAGIQLLIQLTPLLTQSLTFLAIKMTEGFWLPFVNGLNSASFSLSGFATGFKSTAMSVISSTKAMLGAIAPFAVQFVLFDQITGAFNAIKTSMTDLGGDFRDTVDQMKKSSEDFQQSLQKLQKAPPSKPQGFWEKRFAKVKEDPASLIRGTAIGNFVGIKDNSKEALDKAFAIRQGTDNKEVIDRTQSTALQNQVAAVQSLDKQLEEIQIKRRALVQLNPGDDLGLKRIQAQEQEILKQREQQVAPIAKTQKDLQSRVDFLKKSLEELPNLKEQGGFVGIEDKYEERVQQVRTELEQAEKAQSELNKKVGIAADAFKRLQLNIRSVADTLSDATDKLTLMTNESKSGVTQKALAGKITPGQEQFLSSGINQASIGQQVKLQQDAIAQTFALLNTDDNQSRMQAFGVSANTGQSRLKTLTDEATDPKDKFLLEQLAGLQQSKLKLSDLRGQLVQARADMIKSLRDQTKQVADYFRDIERQAKESNLEIEKTRASLKFTDAQNKIKAALTGGADNIATQFADSIIQQIETMKGIETSKFDNKAKLLGLDNQIEDTRRQGLDLKRSLPGDLPKIPVELDFAGVNSDANVKSLNEQFGNTKIQVKGVEEGLSNVNNLIDNGSSFAKQLTAEFSKQIGLTGNLQSGVSGVNNSTQLWNSSLSGINSITSSVKDGFTGIAGTITSLSNQTSSWVASLAKIPQAIADAKTGVVKGVNTFLGFDSKPAPISGNSFVSPLQGVSLEKLVAYQPSKQQGFFGMRDGGKRQHSKVDFDSRVGGGQGAVTLASMGGTASFRAITPVSGGVTIKTKDSQGRDIEVVYNHLALPELVKNFGGFGKTKEVKAGERLSTVTMDGLSSGPHLDYGIKIGGKYVDPQKFIKESGIPMSKMQTASATSTASSSSGSGASTGGGKYANKLNNLSPEFLAKTAQVAAQLGTKPEYLLAVMGFETGGSYSPSITNPLGYTGLIQFSPQYSPGNVGKTTGQLRQMSQLQQLDYVKPYLDKNRQGKSVASIEDLYMSVLMPILVGKGANAKLPGWAYRSNKGLDIDKDGAITAAEATAKVRDYLPNQQTMAKLYGGRKPQASSTGRSVQQAAIQNSYVSPATLQKTVTAGEDTKIASLREQQKVADEQYKQDVERDKNEILRTAQRNLFQVQRSRRDTKDQGLESRRGITDLKYESTPYRTKGEEFQMKITNTVRKFDDEKRKREYALQDIDRIIADFEPTLLRIPAGKEFDKQRAEAQKTLAENKALAAQLRKEITTIEATKKDTITEAKRIDEREKTDRESQRKRDQYEALIQEGGSRLEGLKTEQQTRPSNELAKQINLLQKEVDLNRLNLELEQSIDAISKKVFKKEDGITREQGEEQIAALRRNNEEKQKNVELTYQQVEAERVLTEQQDDMDRRSRILEIQNGLMQERLKATELRQQRNPLDRSLGNPLEINRDISLRQLETDYERKVFDIRSNKKISDPERNDLIALESKRKALQESNIGEQFRNDKELQGITDLETIASRAQKKTEFETKSFIDLANLKTQRERDLGGNPFVANAMSRKTSAMQEQIRYQDELRNFDAQVAQMRFNDYDIPDEKVAAIKANLADINQMNLDGINDQFKTFGGTLNDVARNAFGGLSSSLTDLIVKGGSFTDILDNLADTLLSGALNAAFSSLGGLFGGGGGLFSPKPQKQSGGDGIFGLLSGALGMFGGGGGLLGLFSSGGIVKNYAYGGIHQAMQKERSQSGRTPQVIIAHEGELLIPHHRVQELEAQGLSHRELLGFADGGIVGGDRPRYSPKDKQSSTIRIETTRINNQEYVTIEQMQAAMEEAANQGGAKGVEMVTDRFQNDSSFRSSVGIR